MVINWWFHPRHLTKAPTSPHICFTISHIIYRWLDLKHLVYLIDRKFFTAYAFLQIRHLEFEFLLLFASQANETDESVPSLACIHTLTMRLGANSVRKPHTPTITPTVMCPWGSSPLRLSYLQSRLSLTCSAVVSEHREQTCASFFGQKLDSFAVLIL